MTAIERNISYSIEFFSARDHRECTINGVKFAFFDFESEQKEIHIDKPDFHVILLSPLTAETIKIRALTVHAFNALSVNIKDFDSCRNRFVREEEINNRIGLEAHIRTNRDLIVSELREATQGKDHVGVIDSLGRAVDLVHFMHDQDQTMTYDLLNHYFDIPDQDPE